MAFDANGNIQSYTRPTQAQSNNAPGADGAFLQLSGYTAFNLPTSITKSLGGTIQASAEFFCDAGYQRTRQIKRSGPTQTGTFVDDILYVVPGGFEVHRNATGQIIKSIATLSGSDGVVATVTTNFDAITGIPLAQLPTAQNGFDVSSNNSGVNTVTKLILKDHLGSMVAEITLEGSPQAPTVQVSMLSIHGFGPWGNARNQTAALAEGQRGFTGHEHVAELGIIHMNGRLYDPVIGRFLQADPIIQAPHNAQSHNRYSYVMNNPLSMSDPSGFSWWMQWRSSVVAAATYVVVAWATGGCLACAQFAANAVRAGMNAHANGTNALQAIASNALGAYLGGPILDSGIEVALNGANRRQIAGAIVGGIIGDIVGQQMDGMTSIAAGGCASAMVNRGSCWTGARDSMIAAGIQAAGTRAYVYLIGDGSTGQNGSSGGSRPTPLFIGTTDYIDETRSRIAREFPELLPRGTTLEIAPAYVQAGMSFSDIMRVPVNVFACACLNGIWSPADGVTLGQNAYVSRAYGVVDLSVDGRAELMGLAVHELLHAYLNRTIGVSDYLANEPFHHGWIYQKQAEFWLWAREGYPGSSRPTIALPGGSNP
ncbi:MAG: RHS repeat-associated core domain-containing protein [Rhizobacter sp.]|nr:RHS repeat-associated core domain-containing protein [Burkholderiales bacterium]